MASRPSATHKLPLGVRASFGTLPPPAGKFCGPAIVLGRAPGWEDELDLAFDVTMHEAPIFAVNHQAGHYPGLIVEHVVSVHCQKFPHPARRDIRTLYHGCKPIQSCPWTDCFWPMPGVGGSGSSALLATLVALNMGHAPVFVAGVHLEEVTCVEDEHGKRIVHSYQLYQDGWHTWVDRLRGRVFSVSPRGTFLRDLLEG